MHVAHLAPEQEVWVGDDTDGAVTYALPITRKRIHPGTTTYGPFTIEAELVRVEPTRRGLSFSREWAAMWALSALLHAVALGAVALEPPASLDPDEHPIDRAFHAKLANGGLSSPDSDERESSRPGPRSASGNDLGAAHRGASGALGTTTTQGNAHFAIKGPPETTEQKLARARALIESSNYGALSVFAAALASPGPFAGDADDNLGTDERTAHGDLFGAHASDAFGPNGLGLSGYGAGGGSDYGGIGIGVSGLFGSGGFAHGSGTRTGSGFGSGWGAGCGKQPKPCGRRTRVVRLIEVADDVQGTLPPDTVRRVVRANFPRLRACYEPGLKRDPSLAGTVSVRFIIDSTGAVESANSAGGTLADTVVRACVLGVYRTLSFPEPEHGKVMVTYPIDFQPE